MIKRGFLSLVDVLSPLGDSLFPSHVYDITGVWVDGAGRTLQCANVGRGKCGGRVFGFGGGG